jgi:hypothetical protein
MTISYGETKDIKITAKMSEFKQKKNNIKFGIDLDNSILELDLRHVSQKNTKEDYIEQKYAGVISFQDGQKNLKFNVKNIELIEYTINDKPIKHGAIDCWIDDTPITISLYLSEDKIFAFTVFGDMSDYEEVIYGDYFQEVSEFEKIRRQHEDNKDATVSTDVTSQDIIPMATSDVIFRGTTPISYDTYTVRYVGLYCPSQIKDTGGEDRPIGGRLWSKLSGIESWYLSKNPNDIVLEKEVDYADGYLDVSKSPYFQLYNEFDPSNNETSVSVPVVFYYNGSLYNWNVKLTTSSTTVSNSKINSGYYYNKTSWEFYKLGGFPSSETEMETTNGANSDEGFAYQNNFAFQGDVNTTETYNIYSLGKMRFALFVLIGGNENNSYTKYYWTSTTSKGYTISVVE